MQIAARAFHGAKVCLIPMPANDHRPLALRHSSLSFVSVLLIIAKVAAVTILTVTPTTAELSTITSARIVQLTNAERTAKGLPALKVNSQLSSAAAKKAQDILTNDYFAHISPTGVTPWFWIKQAGYTYQVAGENLAIDFTEAEDVVSAWMASPTHKANILLTDYTETGVAVATGEFQGSTSTVVVHMFGLPVGAPKPASVAATPTPTVKSSITRTSPTPTAVPKTTTTPLVTAAPTIAPTPTVTPTAVPVPSVSVPPTVPPNVIPVRTPQIASSWVSPFLNLVDAAGKASATVTTTFAPQFKTEVVDNQFSPPARFSQLTRRLTGAILVALFILLSLSIIIRIEIQHPTLIAHTAVVMILATVLWLF